MLKTAESVSPKHPDKLCDRISDAILDECLRNDPDSRVAIETMGGHGLITITGELTTKEWVDIPKIVKEIVGGMAVQTNIIGQSPDIAKGVDTGGAGDQGIMVGYACRDNEDMIPQELYLARNLCKFIYEKYPEDGKTQITIDEDNQIKTIVASFANTTTKELKDKIVWWSIDMKIDIDKAIIHANPAGDWKDGGFKCDTGLTGRKLAIDNYGPQIPIGGGAFCVDGETEYLTQNGWKKISEYSNEKVAQYNENGYLEFVKPKNYINEYSDKLYHFESTAGLNQTISLNHNFIYISTRGNLNKKPFKHIKKLHESTPTGFRGKIITSFKYNNGEGINLSDDELRLQIAAIADGSYMEETNTCRFRLLKQRKINRLVDILERLNLKYNKRTLKSDGFTYITVKTPRKDKEFTEYYWNVNKKQREVIADEIFHWDGDVNKQIYRTTIKKSADFIQFVLTSIYNKRVSILVSDRRGEIYHGNYIRKSICYRVCVGKFRYVSMRRSKNKVEIKEITPINKRKYCFEVDSGMLILRRDNKIFITGNSGKDASKVDRSGAYMARKIAVDFLRNHGANDVVVKLAYSIGVAEPVMINIVADGKQREMSVEYDLTPKGIIDFLELKKPQFQKTAEWGHFGNGFKWDQC